MYNLYQSDLLACHASCPMSSQKECESLCSRAAAINSYNERGKIFSVPFSAPPNKDLDVKKIDEVESESAFSLLPWVRAAPVTSYSIAGGVPPRVPRADGRSGILYDWDQESDSLSRRTAPPSSDQEFAGAVDLNQATSGYLLHPARQRTEDGPLSAEKSTARNSASYLPQAKSSAGTTNFYLPRSVPRSWLADVRGESTFLQSPTKSDVRGVRLANLSG